MHMSEIELLFVLFIVLDIIDKLVINKKMAYKDHLNYDNRGGGGVLMDLSFKLPGFRYQNIRLHS